jgi:hypothetical protein
MFLCPVRKAAKARWDKTANVDQMTLRFTVDPLYSES